MLVSEILECHGCGEFEKRRVERLKESALFFNEIYYILLANTGAINAYSLTKIFDVWRCV